MKNRLFSILIFFAVVLFFLFQLFVGYVSNKIGISGHCAELKDFISLNGRALESVFTNSFDQATTCQTEACRLEQITATKLSLRGSHNLTFYESSYFIRLNADKNIEKLFLSGEVKTTIPTTAGEKRVTRLLQGRATPICTQNWKIDASATAMTYLKDGYSEAEIILPVKKLGQVIGAIVMRFGD